MIKITKLSKQFSRFMLAGVMCIGLLLAQAPAANAAGPVTIDIGSVSGGGDGFTYAAGVVTITAGGDYTVTGTTTSNTLAVAASIPDAVNLTLSSVSMTNLSRSSLTVGAGSTVYLILSGTSVLSIQNTASNIAGIDVPAGSTLRIVGTGRLDVTGMGTAAGIGAAGTISIDSGTVNATGGYSQYNAGGSGIRGNVQINGGTVTAKGGMAPNNGSGSGLAGTVTINGGTVTAQAGEGMVGGAGIGGSGLEGGGTVTINGGTVTATGDMLNGQRGAGIGGGYNCSCGTVVINGGTVIATGGTDAAGIGGGYAGSGGNVTITNMNGNTNVSAHGKNGGAGIGGGRGLGGNGGGGGTINISGGMVTADGTGGLGGAGIGGGYIGTGGGQITISGGTVHATGGYNSAGIGGGESCNGGTINISGGDVTAQAGDQGAGIGCGYNRSSNGGVKGGAITITGGTVSATGGARGAGIGGGFNASGDTIQIGGSASVTATGGQNGAGIGGGANQAADFDGNANGGTITIGGGLVTATGRDGGAGIGGGYMGNAGAITINGGRVIAGINSSTGGAPIGSGVNSSDLLDKYGTNTVTVNGGTVRATGGTYDIGGGGTCFSLPVTNTFNGGSIDIATVNKVPVSNAKNVYRTTITVKNADQTALTDTDVTYQVGGGASVSARTDGAGKLYLWLPTAASATVQVASGSKEYAASGPVTADNAAAMTAIEQIYSIDPIGNLSFTDLVEGYASGSQAVKTVTVSNTGTATLTNLTVLLGAGESAWFDLSASALGSLAPGATANFTVKAKDGVASGSYTAHVTVRADKLGDVTFQAAQTVRLINVDFINSGSTVATRTVHANATIGLASWPADPVKTGYDFNGWFTGAGIQYTTATSFTQDTTLTAKWTAISYAIAYDLDGGSVNPANPTSYTVESGGITLHNPVKPGLAFAGWSGTGITGNAMSVTIPTGSTGNRSYLAHWTANPTKVTVTVTFDSQGGSPVASMAAEQNATIPVPAAPTRDGHTFGGWYKQAACTAPWDFQADRVTADITLFAKWTANKYAIAATANNAAYGSVAGSGSYAHGASVTLTAVPKAGYCFVRWVEGGTAVSTGYQYSFKVEKARTLTAEFAKIGSPEVTAAPAGYNGVKLTWTAVAGADGYEVYRAASKTGAYAQAGTAGGTGYTDAGLTTGKTYYYKVRAKFVTGGTAYGGFSAIVSAKPVPAAPASLKAAAASNTSIKLIWSAVPGASGYEIYRATSKTGAYGKVGSVGAAALGYTNMGLKDNRTYYYKVRAYRTVGGVKVYGGFGAVVTGKP